MLDEMPEKIKKTLIVVAHPDDETLWFLAGIKTLSRKSDVDLFCLTYSAESTRGQELLKACKNLKVNIIFGGSEDPGINKCVKNVDACVRRQIEKAKIPYHLVITHPPHGGEKPHPHHIQLFHAVRGICLEKNLDFGFFSEKEFKLRASEDNKFSFPRRSEIQLMLSFYKILFIKRSGIRSFLKDVSLTFRYLSSKNDRQCFEMKTFFIPAEEKQIALSQYESQMKYLKQYKSFSLEKEYLYFTASRI